MNKHIRHRGFIWNAELIASRMFAEMLHLYTENGRGTKEVIRDMVKIVNDSDATTQERDAAVSTLAELLFPSSSQ